ncbi:MAG: ABC transporter permease [Anaerolineales bacterium]|nr:ABC transporter permease [Anaerolineales bacterium]
MITQVRNSWRTIFTVAEMTLRQNVMDLFIIFTVLVQPMLIAILALAMLRDKGQEYILFVVVGSGMTGIWSSLLFISGNSINVERWSGTLESLVGMPTSLSVIVFGKNLANVGQSLLSMVVAYTLAVIIFDYDLTFSQPILFIISLLLTIIAFISFGLVIAPVFVMNPSVQRWQNAMEFPIYILCGFLFPIAMLPQWTTPISYLLTPYWAARALHGTSAGNAPLSQTLFAWGMMVFFSVIYFSIAARLFKFMLVKARTDATLDME